MGENYEVRVTEQAQEQLSAILNYIIYEIGAPEAAGNLLDDIEECIMGLDRYPEKYSLVDEEPWRTEGVRKVLVDNFIVYFWIDKLLWVVQVIAVIYSKRNQIEQLKKIKLD